MIRSQEGMTNLVDMSGLNSVGNRQMIKATKTGTNNGTESMPDRSIRKVSLHDCKFGTVQPFFNYTCVKPWIQSW